MRTCLAAATAVAAVFVGLGAGLGCGGGTASAPRDFGPLPPRQTEATLAGPLCEGQACRCAASPAEAGLPASPTQKRFEIRIGPTPNELWVDVGGARIYKSVERATECFYIDLSKGEHPVTMRAHGTDGFGAQLHIHELAAIGEGEGARPTRYDTFDFECGGPGPCDLELLDEYKAGLAKFPRGLHDPCGSTKALGTRWETSNAPDLITPSDLVLKLTLEVYHFRPKAPHGDASCADKFE